MSGYNILCHPRRKQPKFGSNKGFLAIGAKARLSQNPDVGIRIYGLPHVKWILHHPPAKSIDRAATISDRSRA